MNDKRLRTSVLHEAIDGHRLHQNHYVYRVDRLSHLERVISLYRRPPINLEHRTIARIALLNL